ncbi:MAG: hypothetical protein CME32_00890 [Gimesia sp.]|nr:hypothetical protein [Gimesia sp.]
MSLLLDCRPVRAPLSGVARYCIGLSNALAQGLALELDLLVQTDGRDFQYVNHLPDGLKKVQGRYLSRFPFIQNGLLEYCPSLGRIMFGSGYRVTHETYFANMGSWRRAQKIATIHDVIPLERPELFSDRLVKYSLRNFFRQVEEADLLISVSEYTREKIIEYAPLADSKIIVIGNGVDESILSRSESNAFQEDALLRGLSYFAFVGNIEPRKNLLTLAKAFDAAFPAPSQKNW